MEDASKLSIPEGQAGEEYPEFDLELVTQACAVVGITDSQQIRLIMGTALEEADKTGQPPAQILEEALKLLASELLEDAGAEGSPKES
ncbi:MAG: hypothetical protein ABII10_01330 [Candidatus Paceibacterota bacterium]